MQAQFSVCTAPSNPASQCTVGAPLGFVYSSGPFFPSLSCGSRIVSLNSVLSPPQILFDWFHLYVIHLSLCSMFFSKCRIACLMSSALTCRPHRPLHPAPSNFCLSFLSRRYEESSIKYVLLGSGGMAQWLRALFHCQRTQVQFPALMWV